MRERANVLPGSLPPRGLSRVQAAAYIGVSPSLFDAMVKDGRMPKPTRINTRAVWDRMKLDEAFAALPHDDNVSGQDEWSNPVV
jgi:predicted DNA-binding transcriptional regulator AlpA